MSSNRSSSGRRVAVVVAALGVLALAPAPTPKPAESVEQKQVAAFLSALNAGTDAAMKEFIVKNFSSRVLARMPVEPRLRRLRGFGQEAAPLEMKKALEPSPEGPGFVARSKKTGQWYEIRLTAGDLLAFDRALASGKLLPPMWTAWIYSDKRGPPSDKVPPAAEFGLGAAGGAAGVNAVVQSDNGSGYTIVVLANLDPPVAERIAARLRRWMKKIGKGI